MQKNATAGMTLFELLIVVAIIGILMTILIPNLFGAKAKAYDTKALSCAHSMMRATVLYELDNKVAVKVAKPDLPTLQSIDSGGTKVCQTIPNHAQNVTLQYNNSASGFEIRVKHPVGKVTYIVTANGITGV